MKMTRDAKKGFTLVEVLVVMVILAILAAAVIPSMTGYIDKAKNKAILTEARAVYVAAQSAVSEYSVGLASGETMNQIVSSGENRDPDKSINDFMEELLGSEFEGEYSFLVVENQVKVVEYTSKDGITISIPEGESVNN